MACSQNPLSVFAKTLGEITSQLSLLKHDCPSEAELPLNLARCYIAKAFVLAIEELYPVEQNSEKLHLADNSAMVEYFELKGTEGDRPLPDYSSCSPAPTSGEAKRHTLEPVTSSANATLIALTRTYKCPDNSGEYLHSDSFTYSRFPYDDIGAKENEKQDVDGYSLAFADFRRSTAGHFGSTASLGDSDAAENDSHDMDRFITCASHARFCKTTQTAVAKQPPNLTGSHLYSPGHEEPLSSPHAICSSSYNGPLVPNPAGYLHHACIFGKFKRGINRFFGDTTSSAPVTQKKQFNSWIPAAIQCLKQKCLRQ